MAIIDVPAATGSTAPSDAPDLVRLIKAAYLARFKDQSRTHTASDLNVFLT